MSTKLTILKLRKCVHLPSGRTGDVLVVKSDILSKVISLSRTLSENLALLGVNTYSNNNICVYVYLYNIIIHVQCMCVYVNKRGFV